ncbi:MAG: hypothetical protein KGP28_02045 [Bdellovibrionales bacterium]|nr:hypothetical protein [Bdellovibrionales bacterium]
MILLNFIPEVLITGLLLGSLLLTAFFMPTRGSHPILVSISAFSGLVYYFLRSDLSFFEASGSMVLSDSISFFLRMIALLSLGGFTLSVFFHGNLSLRDKQRAVLFLQFFSLFLCGVALSQNLVGFLVSSLGVYFSASSVIFIESAGSQSWVKVFREKSVWMGTWSLLIAILFVLSTSVLRTVRFSEWSTALEAAGPGGWPHATLVVLVVLCGLMPLASGGYTGKGPLGLAVAWFGQLIVLIAFWTRVGVPVLESFSAVSNQMPRWFLGAAISAITLRSALKSIVTRDHHAWLSAIYPVLIGLVVFSILLPGDRAIPSLFILTIGTFLTFILLSHAFLESEYRNKTLILFALIAVPGAPPLVMGDRYYQMISDLLGASNFISAIGIAVVWLVMLIASTQIIGKVLLVRVSKENQRPFTPGEAFFLVFYLIGVITLSSLHPQLIAVLYRHPPLNLW